MKVILPIAGICLALLIGAIWYIDKTEHSESHFETYQALQSSELIAKGWVPSLIPRSAYDIYEEHRVDQDRVHVRFRFLPGDTAHLQESCTTQSKNTVSTSYQCRHGSGAITVRLTQDGMGEIVSN